MRVGLVGIGKMGGGILRRLQKNGHDVVAFDSNNSAKDIAEEAGATFTNNLADLVNELEGPRVIWIMVPSKARFEYQDRLGPVDQTLNDLNNLLAAGDIVIDGGNSMFEDSISRAKELAEKKIRYVDAGVSGGLSGEETGYALMVGGDKEDVGNIDPILKSLAINKEYAHVGGVGSGHYVKMVHNAVEYGMMQAIGEGFDLLKNGPIENLDLKNIAENWQQGTIVRSYLMDTAAASLKESNDLGDIAAYVDDSGEGRWAVDQAVKHKVPFWVNTAALFARFDSRQEDNFSHKLIAAIRKQFGGHAVKSK